MVVLHFPQEIRLRLTVLGSAKESTSGNEDLFWNHMSPKFINIMHSINDTISMQHAWSTLYEYGAL
ncbi:MAG: hypothetical protein A2521_07325 [Deltaproteobacteria bacterium RIFOXYD12_FULL_57_12]|nr:MAG: hypothetical protein A2521_07325 [Deltaproteobacteria bacterium RIFOXYD12_FULL_57_12]